MTRKQLPKAIRPSDADLHVVSAGPDLEAPAPLKAARAKPAIKPEIHGEILPPSAIGPAPVDPSASPQEAEDRLRKAFALVERYQFFSGLGGVFPVAAVNVASITAVNLRMVKRLSDLYGVPFEQDKTRSIVVGLMGGAAPTGLAAATATTLMHVIPAAGAIGIVVSSVSAAMITRRIGMAYLERFEAKTFG
jgi:uncharacterized protein (DUF697 family)